MKAKTLAALFLTFLKIGAFTFGGGYAMIPLIKKEASEKHGWITDAELLEIFAIAESTPGPIAVNAATFVGYRTAGVAGAFLATLAVVLPAFGVISVFSMLLARFGDLRPVRFALFGVRAGVMALIVRGLVSMYREMPKNAFSYVVAGLAFLAVGILRLNVFAVLFCCAAAGLVYAFAAERRARR